VTKAYPDVCAHKFMAVEDMSHLALHTTQSQSAISELEQLRKSLQPPKSRCSQQKQSHEVGHAMSPAHSTQSAQLLPKP
jgi:hypothetical protein